MAVDNDGNNALHLLLSTYHYVNHKDEYRTTLSLLIEKAPALVHQKNMKPYNPFHYAIQGRRKWSCQLLLDAGADPLEPDPEGNTPLHHLARRRGSRQRRQTTGFRSSRSSWTWASTSTPGTIAARPPCSSTSRPSAQTSGGTVPPTGITLALSRPPGRTSLRRTTREKPCCM